MDDFKQSALRWLKDGECLFKGSRHGAKIERQGRALKLSSLKWYEEAVGGTLRVDIELPDGQHHEFTL